MPTPTTPLSESVEQAIGAARPTIPVGLWLIEPQRMQAWLQHYARATPSPSLLATAEQRPQVKDVETLVLSGVMFKTGSGWGDEADKVFGIANTMKLAGEFKRLAAAPENRGALLVVDSPGGYSDSVGELTAAMDAYRAAGKTLHAYVSDTCASAALWAAAHAEHITAGADSFVGSIGVYSVLADESEYWKAQGITWELVTTGGVKGAGADGKITDEQRENEQRIVNTIRDRFVATIAAGRKMTTDAAGALATGEMWIANEARDRGLVDMVSTCDSAMSYIRTAMNEKDQLAAMTAELVDTNKQLTAAQKRVAELEEKQPKPAQAKELLEAFPDHAFCMDQLVANATMAQASLAWAKQTADKIKAQEAEIADLKAKLAAANSGQPGVAFTPADAETKAKAEAEEKAAANDWKAQGFTSARAFELYQQQLERGNIKVIGPVKAIVASVN